MSGLPEGPLDFALFFNSQLFPLMKPSKDKIVPFGQFAHLQSSTPRYTIGALNCDRMPFLSFDGFVFKVVRTFHHKRSLLCDVTDMSAFVTGTSYLDLSVVFTFSSRYVALLSFSSRYVFDCQRVFKCN